MVPTSGIHDGPIRLREIRYAKRMAWKLATALVLTAETSLGPERDALGRGMAIPDATSEFVAWSEAQPLGHWRAGRSNLSASVAHGWRSYRTEWALTTEDLHARIAHARLDHRSD